MRLLNSLCIFILINISFSQTAQILGIFPLFSYSHYKQGLRVLKALAERGHEVTFISQYKKKSPTKNFEDVTLTGLEGHVKGMEKLIHVFEYENMNIFSRTIGLYTMGLQTVEQTMEHSSFQKILTSNKTFDLIITEPFVIDTIRGLSYKYNAPLILVSPLVSTSFTNFLVGNPEYLSSIPEIMSAYAINPMNFYLRLRNTFDYIVHSLIWTFFAEPRHNTLIQKYLPGAPKLHELKTSLIFLNSHPAFSQAVPHVPNMIEIGGYHIDPPTELPTILQNYLDESENGVICFSFGSILKSKDLSEQNKRVFQNVFRKLKVNVIWKYEGDDITDSSDTVLIYKWVPQLAVLAHRNVKVFITHGGLLSIIEAVHHGKPIIGIPVLGDQPKNVQQAVLDGYGLSVPFHDLSEERLYKTITEMLFNKSYAETARKRSQILRDYPIKPLDNAMYWTEFVLKHGTDHMQFSHQHLNWVQANLIDVILFFATCLIMCMASIILLYKIIFARKQHFSNGKKTN